MPKPFAGTIRGMARMQFSLFSLLPTLLLVIPVSTAKAEPPDRVCSSRKLGQVQCIRSEHFVHDTCQAIDVFSRRFGLDTGYFARLIWQESRFDPNAVSHAGAQGIAQFMPHTARRRGLANAFNPADALAHSAAYLAEMQTRYGNPGLAAVGYNGGERRAEGIIKGTGGLMPETVNYVRIITGLGHEDWLKPDVKNPDMRLSKTLPFRQACHQLARGRRLSPMPRPRSAIKTWGVQIAYGVTKSRARAEYKSRVRRCAGLVKKRKPDLVWQKSRASPKGGYWMVRLGYNSRDKAWRFCGRLKQNGCRCTVFRNRG